MGSFSKPSPTRCREVVVAATEPHQNTPPNGFVFQNEPIWFLSSFCHITCICNDLHRLHRRLQTGSFRRMACLMHPPLSAKALATADVKELAHILPLSEYDVQTKDTAGAGCSHKVVTRAERTGSRSARAITKGAKSGYPLKQLG